MSPPVLLDTSFLVAYERETARGVAGPASRCLARLRGRRLVISVVTLAEVLEGADDHEATLASLRRFNVQPLNQAHAERCARIQRHSPRRLGENDAWVVATAEVLQADIVGKDRRAFERLGSRYLRFA